MGPARATPPRKLRLGQSPQGRSARNLDAYLFVEHADALYADYVAQGVEFARGLGNVPWHKREFVVKDCDGRLLAFGANL